MEIARLDPGAARPEQLRPMQAVPFGPYRVLGRLATGGQAEIYLAAVEPGSVPVCLKLLRPVGAGLPDREAMFVSEARITTMLRHENCVAAFEWGRVRTASYMALEYILGETVHDLINRSVTLERPIPTHLVAAIIASACEGVHHLHELRDDEGRPYGVIHRDLSPANLMLTQEGGVKVLDFGIVKGNISDRPETRTGLVKGRPTYMSPEQITGRRIDRRSDVYTLGVILFECLGLRKLFAGPTTRSIAERILSGAPNVATLLPEVPAGIAAVCQRAIAVSAEDRFQTAGEMADALRRYIMTTGEDTSASAIAVLLADRFGDSLTLRRRALHRILDQTIDEAALTWLGASPVTALELFGPAALEDAQVTVTGVLRAEEARTVVGEPDEGVTASAARVDPAASLEQETLVSVTPSSVRAYLPKAELMWSPPQSRDQEDTAGELPTATSQAAARDDDVTDGLRRVELAATGSSPEPAWIEPTVVAEVPRYPLRTLILFALFVLSFGTATGLAVGLWLFMGK